ncbi:DUF1014-domain-containing protein [Auriculariales sp. MPI-PUGE-AT-0066]|nr:DUF1014-domain-containing protein [Auriculariales sp. MPI-PUGE-AT-0066]
MPPKGGNAKKEAGRAKKAENEGKKQAAVVADKERKEAATWDEGSKKSNAKVASAEEKRKADLARKQETARLLEAEESAAPSKKAPAPKAGQKKATAASKPAGPGALAAGGLASITAGASGSGSGGGSDQPETRADAPVESFSATGIDDALELLDVVTAKADKASVGQQAAGIERHPERRFKAAFEAYQERELPIAKKDHPGLRLQQYKDLLFKQFQKSPENPFNQVTVAYDASKEDKVSALENRNKQLEERLRERTQNLTLDD